MGFRVTLTRAAMAMAALTLTACGAMRGDGAASTATSSVTADAHHVVDGSGRRVSDAYNECVNTGHSSSAHAGACGSAVAQATDAPAPAISEPAAVTAQPVPPTAVEAAPQPMPEVTRGEVVHAVDQLSLEADALFQFARSDAGSMLPAGKKRLDELAARIASMDKASISAIHITGHADRLGSTSANQALSSQRARTVMQYLASRGVAANLMQASGKGETMPVVSCPGDKATDKLKACLAANRRVEVVVYGR